MGVYGANGAPVGVIYEWHDFDGEKHLPITFDIAHNPDREPGKATWSSKRHPTSPTLSLPSPLTSPRG